MRRFKDQEPIVVYPEKKLTSKRGETYYGPNLDEPVEIGANLSPISGSADAYKMMYNRECPGLTVNARIEWLGREWDIVEPPQFHPGPRQIQHWSTKIRARA